VYSFVLEKCLFFNFLFKTSTKIIASFTTIQAKDINHIMKGTEYEFQVKYNQIFIHKIVIATLYNIKIP
jgi:hypothetical protein